MKRPDPFDIHALIPLNSISPSNLIGAVRDSFRETLRSVGSPLSEEEEALLDGLVRIVYLQCSLTKAKPRLSKLLAVCAQAACDEIDSSQRGRLMHLGVRLQRVYACPIKIDDPALR